MLKLGRGDHIGEQKVDELTEDKVRAIVEEHIKARSAADQITPSQRWEVVKLFGGLSVGLASLLAIGVFFGVDGVSNYIAQNELRIEVESEVRRVVNDESPDWWVDRFMKYNDFSEGITSSVSGKTQ